jgi:hypothetical protein
MIDGDFQADQSDFRKNAAVKKIFLGIGLRIA